MTYKLADIIQLGKQLGQSITEQQKEDPTVCANEGCNTHIPEQEYYCSKCRSIIDDGLLESFTQAKEKSND